MMQSWEEKQALRASAAAKLQSEHPHLVGANGKGGSLIAAAKNIRTELRAAFPRTVFSVHTSRFSGGDSIDIRWTDGPTNKQVEAISWKYSAGSFDGMTDCYNYSQSTWTDAFGDAKYVHTQRHYSDTLIGTVLDQVRIQLGGIDIVPTVAMYKRGELWKVKQSGGCDYDREVNTTLYNYSCEGK